MREPDLLDMVNNAVFTDSGKLYIISCKKGLWGVDSSSYEQALKEAWHYFVQYWEDGEYEDATN